MIQFSNNNISGKTPGNKKQPVKKEIDDKFIVPYPDEPNVIDDTFLEIETIKNNFQSSLDKEKKTKKEQITANYYFTVYFQDELQKDEFLKKSGLMDKTKGLFVNGFDLAEAFDIYIQKK